ncbi:hypothetical protein LLS47_24475 [Rouxiella badensis]|uniref:hypothetical protein n=1 Tax=Rouxiella badensis TaxID=1646377 RepID=UPI001D13D6F9|nr:hypothetical protein [Rouxiella badensis]MCC3721470.1 hypothetical protein [Rouxiella badensis]MCC3731080.1 hypothetical protein [Rouxiella badensis]MCC3736047.1 hypothetical protein [Rouxiella badensis]MCC3742923.1 hypothetical protein [Rouxiella badensis]MCC3761189.1 hypothetical protein [Rouxiella badensis]
MNKPRVSNIAYSLGELAGTYSEASGFKEVIERESMLPFPEMWGWGNYYATKNIFSLAQQSIKKTLNGAKISPGEIDLVIICAAMLPGRSSDLNTRIAEILKSVGIDRANIIGQTLGGCATTLNSMIMASELILANVYKNILVVAAESLPDELNRFENFAVFSDASVSFLVSSGSDTGFEIVASTYNTSIKEISDGIDLQDPVLNKESVFQTIDKAKMQLSDIKKVFSNNTFLPIKMLKERNIGFTNEQIYSSNVASIGHCFSCDSLLNYCLFNSTHLDTNEGYYLLLAEADGHSASILITETSS